MLTLELLCDWKTKHMKYSKCLVEGCFQRHFKHFYLYAFQSFENCLCIFGEKKAGSGKLQITYYFIFKSKFNFRSLKSLFLNQNRLITLPDELGNTVNKSLLHFDRLIFGIALKKKGHDYPLFWMDGIQHQISLFKETQLISSAICVQLFTSSHI